MKLTIQKHENLSTQNWYGTSLDSQMFFKETWYGLDNSFKDKYFEIGNNGGSYSLNFNSEDLDTILDILNIDLSDISYVQDITRENGMRDTFDVTKKEYLKYNTSQTRDEFTDYLAPFFEAML